MLVHGFAKRTIVIFGGVLALILSVLFACFSVSPIIAMTSVSQLLTDPFLQLPTANSVRVVWFTEFAGTGHVVNYGNNLALEVSASTTKLSRTREDQNSRIKGQTKENIIFPKPTLRDIWRHEAIVEGLKAGEKLPYRVMSLAENGEKIESRIFSLSAAPAKNKALKILLTSDHQLKPMVSANLQKVEETLGRLDAVFFAGDLVNVPDRASEWFDDELGGSFFPCLQGRAGYRLEKNGINTVYKGGEIIQHSPLFATIGNHEVMGRFSEINGLNAQFSDAFPRNVAEILYSKSVKNVKNENQIWLKNNSFNTDTYEEILSLPESKDGGKTYYAVTFGDVRLVVLYVTNVWRFPGLDAETRGKYRERQGDFANPEAWGYGQHIFEPVSKGSKQYEWLENELKSGEFQEAKYKVVMFHHPPHSLGENSVPAYTNPVQVIERDKGGKVTAIRYEYPVQDDYIIRDVLPLLEKAGVQLVYYGHSHLWNRFVSEGGMHFLESSNVGNSYGAYVGDKKRNVPVGYEEDYAAVGNPNGLRPVVPSIAPLLGEDGKAEAFIASDDLTVFSIFDTGTGTVSSYYFDTRKPGSNVIKFDEFVLGAGE